MKVITDKTSNEYNLQLVRSLIVFEKITERFLKVQSTAYWQKKTTHVFLDFLKTYGKCSMHSSQTWKKFYQPFISLSNIRVIYTLQLVKASFKYSIEKYSNWINFRISRTKHKMSLWHWLFFDWKGLKVNIYYLEMSRYLLDHL